MATHARHRRAIANYFETMNWQTAQQRAIGYIEALEHNNVISVEQKEELSQFVRNQVAQATNSETDEPWKPDTSHMADHVYDQTHPDTGELDDEGPLL